MRQRILEMQKKLATKEADLFRKDGDLVKQMDDEFLKLNVKLEHDNDKSDDSSDDSEDSDILTTRLKKQLDEDLIEEEKQPVDNQPVM